MNDCQKEFARQYAITGDHVIAVLNSYPNVKDRKTAATMGKKLLTHPGVQDYVYKIGKKYDIVQQKIVEKKVDKIAEKMAVVETKILLSYEEKRAALAEIVNDKENHTPFERIRAILADNAMTGDFSREHRTPPPIEDIPTLPGKIKEPPNEEDIRMTDDQFKALIQTLL